MIAENRKGLERETTRYGASKAWLPKRVTYPRELKMKAELDQLQ